MTDKEKILKGFEELNEIIEPYKNKRNYNKLCLRLRFWAKNFQRRLLWKKDPANKDIELEKELNSFFYPHIPWGDFSETERDDIREWSTKIAKHFAAWQMQQLMKGAIDATVESNPDAHGADYGLQKLHIDYGQLEAKGIKPGTKVKVIIIKEDYI